MQVTQSIPSNSYVKGASNILFVLSIVKGGLEKHIRPYIDGRREYQEKKQRRRLKDHHLTDQI